ncbi:MAG: hypothetical protein K9M54_07960, partial [Kiritimatiellales bacterium]|nr:hypothetical protein [Kiritimatiellales bacterium]
KINTSTGKVFTTARFETRTPANKGRNEGQPLKKRQFLGRIAKDGLDAALECAGWTALFKWLCRSV